MRAALKVTELARIVQLKYTFIFLKTRHQPGFEEFLHSEGPGAEANPFR